jgi:hypothetical protein
VLAKQTAAAIAFTFRRNCLLTCASPAFSEALCACVTGERLLPTMGLVRVVCNRISAYQANSFAPITQSLKLACCTAEKQQEWQMFFVLEAADADHRLALPLVAAFCFECHVQAHGVPILTAQ